jgi:hypothetical protein
MGTQNLHPNDYADANSWATIPASNGTKYYVSAVAAPDDGSYAFSAVNAGNIKYLLADSDPSAHSVVSLIVYAKTTQVGSATNKLKIELLIGDVSQGAVEITPDVYPTVTVEEFALEAWNGPWTKEEFDGAKLLLTVTITTGSVIVDDLYAAIIYQTQVATPTFDPDGGEYEDEVEVEMACTTEGATLYYTTDGSTPDETDTEYTGPITLTVDDSPCTLKAIAVADGYDDSEVATSSEFVIAPSAALSRRRVLQLLGLI